MTTSPLRRGSFTAMSTTITVGGVAIDPGELEQALELARTLAEEWECRFSRFLPESMLSRLNAAGGRQTGVDAEFLDLLVTMRDAVIRTGGRFDPSVLPALEAAGYTETIDRVRATPRVALAPRPAAGVDAWLSVEIDRERRLVALPVGMRIDAGGIAKGAFVDRLAERLAHWPGGYVDAGGDIRVWGMQPSGDAWTVSIEDPTRPDTDLAVIRIDSDSLAGVATSSPNRRHWGTGSDARHHLIDPASGASLESDIVSVTAFAPSVTEAEVATKAIMVAAARNEPLETAGSTAAVCVDRDNRLTFLQGPNP